MSLRTTRTLVVFVALVAAASVAYGGWAAHLVDSVLVAETKTEKHAKSLTLKMLTPEAFNNGVALCVIYVNSASKSKGKVTATATRSRNGNVVEQRKFSGKVQRVDTAGVDTGDLGNVTANAFFDCGEFGPMEKNEEVAFKFDMKGFPKLRNNSQVLDGATVSGVLVTNDLGLTAEARRAVFERAEEALLRRLTQPSRRR